MRILIVAAISLVLAGCGSLRLSPNDQAHLYNALDTQPDGYSATLASLAYTIRETLASDTKLCRVVEIDQPGHFYVESYCKAPGGLWR